ncbi:VPLPA-CTERM sorting domain-containing protein [Qingshengfaniella alkalisoli]|uniref:VPLPA-CTERM sorting domain-containing protein n=1 Tax=Qingshengfaniella alkalisoli TaxID=2599296 RepID=UPI00143CE45C
MPAGLPLLISGVGVLSLLRRRKHTRIHWPVDRKRATLRRVFHVNTFFACQPLASRILLAASLSNVMALSANS